MADPKRQTIRIYLKHHNDPEGKFQPKQQTCQDYEQRGHVEKGCGGTVWRFLTYPNEKGMRFDSQPEVVPGTEANLGNGAIVASVYTDNVHFATCTARVRAARPTTGFDGKTAGAGIS